MEYFVNPVNRGFFCNDNSIYFPYKQEIINSTLLAFIIFVMIVVIVSFSYSNCLHVAKIANISVHCLFAIFINLYICQLTKLSVGRLRPHFLAVCRPNIDLEACANTLKYIETYNCTGPYNVVRQARLSFFSGHASIAMTALYLQARFPRHLYGLGSLPLIQMFVLSIALFVGFTRIRDNSHHPSDVLAGYIFGTIVSIIAVFLFLPPMFSCGSYLIN
ncbi:unnamed protein product [Dracunculus medinensis]|uniref:AcidPPc domain-containing protein n=1 Tax=Dracunculus medinensis TaxID=318479 RepID=A0A0N4UJB1_DRAME|nr:unnamed protein product [Dracunculus medinensis]